MGRPRGKKSDPNYRQVTIYLPADLHDKGRDEAIRLQRSSNKDEHRDFSEIVEEALRAYFRKSETSEVQVAKSPKVQEPLNDPQGNMDAPAPRLSRQS